MCKLQNACCYMTNHEGHSNQDSTWAKTMPIANYVFRACLLLLLWTTTNMFYIG